MFWNNNKSSPQSTIATPRAPLAISLEPRMLFDGAVAATVADVATTTADASQAQSADDSSQHATEAVTPPAASSDQRQEIVFVDGKLQVTGTVGADASLEDAQGQARICAINLLAQLKVACGGDLDRVTQVVKLGAFVASAEDFHSQPTVVNAASDLMVDAFGEAGRHARFAVGTNALPLGCLVEIDGIFEIR